MTGLAAPLRLSAVLSLVGSTRLRAHRLASNDPRIDDVVLHGDGDPPAPERSLVLCAATPPNNAAAVAVRESVAATVSERLAVDVPVLVVPDAIRWTELYDAIRRCFADHATDAAENDLFALADAIAGTMGGAVAIEDAERRILAFSTIPGQPIDGVRRDGILGRRVPEHVERAEWYRRLWRADGVVEYEPGPESSARLALAIRAGGERLGSVWVVGNRSTLAPGADEALLRAAPAVASSLVHQQRATSRNRDARNANLRAVLAGDSGEAETATVVVDRLVVVVGIQHYVSPPDRELLDMRLADRLSMHAYRVDNTSLAGTVDGTVYGVLPWVDRTRLEQQLAAALGPRSTSARVAVGPVIHPGQTIPPAAQGVSRLLDVMRGAGDEPSIEYVDEARRRLLMAAIGEGIRIAVPDFDAGADRIRSFDAEHGTQYVATLRAWFDTNGDMGAGARILHVHPNTFRYRIARASDIFGLDLDDAETRLLLHLQLRLAAPG